MTNNLRLVKDHIAWRIERESSNGSWEVIHPNYYPSYKEAKKALESINKNIYAYPPLPDEEPTQ